MKSLWRIEAPHYTCGVGVEDGVVKLTAPILAWAKGKQWQEVMAYCERKRYKVTKVRDVEVQ